MAIKPFFYTIEDACKRTGFSETELFTICHQGGISLCYQFNDPGYGIIQISDDELEKFPYCEESEYSDKHPEYFNKKFEGKGFSVKIRDVSLKDADPIFLWKKNIERFRQEKYHECFWDGLMKIPSKFIRHDGYVLAEWLAPYGFDGLRIAYWLHDIRAEENNEIVKVIPAEELEKLIEASHPAEDAGKPAVSGKQDGTKKPRTSRTTIRLEVMAQITLVWHQMLMDGKNPTEKDIEAIGKAPENFGIGFPSHDPINRFLNAMNGVIGKKIDTDRKSDL